MEPKDKDIKPDQTEETVEIDSLKKPKFNLKILIIGLPLFIVQLIIVYFVTANILLSKMDAKMNDKLLEKSDDSKTEQVEEEEAQTSPIGEHLYQIDDLIVNPANTNGGQLLLSSIAFDLQDEPSKTEITKKEVMVKDIIISVLSGKTVSQLSDAAHKDSIRVEIMQKVKSSLKSIKINNVYFSKYIIN